MMGIHPFARVKMKDDGGLLCVGKGGVRRDLCRNPPSVRVSV